MAVERGHSAYLGTAHVLESLGRERGAVKAHPCLRDVMRVFLGDPERPLDTACIASMAKAFRVRVALRR